MPQNTLDAGAIAPFESPSAVRKWLLVLTVLGSVALAGACAGAVRPNQAALLAGGASGISPSLAAAARQLESGVDPGAFAQGRVRADSRGRLQVYVYVEPFTSAVLAALKTHGLEDAVSSPALRVVQGWVAPANLDGIAALPFVVRITPPQYAQTR